MEYGNSNVPACLREDHDIKRSLAAAAAAVFAAGGIVTAAPARRRAVPVPRRLELHRTAAIQRALAEHLVVRIDADAADLPGRRRHAALPVLRPAAMSDERRGGGGLGAACVLLIFIGASAKFWVYIVAALGALVLFGLLLWLAFRAARRVDAEHQAQAALVALADKQHAWVLADDKRGVYGQYPPAAT
jgi:hypothetical protein